MLAWVCKEWVMACNRSSKSMDAGDEYVDSMHPGFENVALTTIAEMRR